eukprot:CAMPEP_0170222166 /NCGR_PEP_ID=MMETSP0116_2-20130129/10775_1 /TAXON_ID=400756 /ORGANISM="Durinskia baltica, Strain CSIRO CS-38" /LENGTH=2201 /DNA_ID=CAMNT_0010472853 /DNA_START=123 /DNA_END=6728 /DNA_ORIENTATION=-
MVLRILAALLALQGALSAPWTPKNAKWNVNFESQHDPRSYYGKWEGHSYHPSPRDWRSLSIYQLVTDRFSDGDPRNNELYKGDFDVRDMGQRHGGDFVGIRDKLPYIKGLGCRAIWISPVFENGPNSYHQYAMRDFTLLDPRLGTLEELRSLTARAHELGMYVIVDVVMNHMANEFAFEGHLKGATPFAMHETEEYKLVLRNGGKNLLKTPAGEQPYADFWYNNTWDPEGNYGGPVYGKWGESQVDWGKGTYTWSDFHHNGDLVDYTSPWQITMGKIYGTMDDLRLESRRVQEKYIAMTKALISSADIDGFRVDTPMQVPLEFFKAWVPAVKEHARSLGKERFGFFGEFFVETTRYATMTGRGKTPGMYGHEVFIDDTPTLKGGIDYTYYWYMLTSLVGDKRKTEYADGLSLAYESETQMLDLVDPVSNQPEFAMWTFCNNHDNWRLQVMGGPSEMKLCLTVITFWPGTPLHYAGDEQDFNTPGSALDGWAREELAASMAWRAMPTSSEGNPATRDNFDMTTASYRYIRRLNLLRQAYFRDFGLTECDRLDVLSAGFTDVLAFSRGCSEDAKLLLLGNFHPEETRNITVATRWAEGTLMKDLLPEASMFEAMVGPESKVSLSLGPLQVRVFAAGDMRSMPPSVVSVSPPHASIVRPADVDGSLTVRIKFDRAVFEEGVRSALYFDGRQIERSAVECVAPPAVRDTDSAPWPGCVAVHVSLGKGRLSAGAHGIEVREGIMAIDGMTLDTTFRSMFIVEEVPGPLTQTGMVDQPGLICNYLTELCHKAAGAQWMRITNVGQEWTDWMPYQERTEWQAMPGRTVLVQYHMEGSASYIVGDCMLHRQTRCYTSWHETMYLRGDHNTWGLSDDDGHMELVDHFTWAITTDLFEYVNAKFAPYSGWEKSYGKQKAREFRYQLPTFDERSSTFLSDAFYDGTETVRKTMFEAGNWPDEQSIVTGQESANPFWLSHLCNQKPPYPAGLSDTDWQCHPYEPGEDTEWCMNVGEDEDYLYQFNNRSKYMGDCGTCDCCRKVKPPSVSNESRTCCILFNDLYLNYTVTDDLSQCTARPVRPGPDEGQTGSLTISMAMAAFWCAFPFAVAAVGVQRKRSRSVVRMRFSTDQVRPVGSIVWTRSVTTHDPPSSGDAEETSESSYSQQEVEIMRPDRVLFASLEHVIEHRAGREKAIAGGLGKVAGLMCRYHPGSLICVTACMPDKEYSFAEPVGHIKATVSGVNVKVGVLRYEETPHGGGETSLCPTHITFYLVDHPIFRSREDIYPSPQTARRTLEFYSLWCQSVARIIDLEAPDVFHCPDFHGAMAVMYIERPLPVVLVLHNAEYQGAISTQHMGRREAKHLADVFNLSEARIRSETFIEGKFCMLKPIVDYARKNQHGYGICAVSRNYALEASLKHTVLWGLPELRGIENCMPESERMVADWMSDPGQYKEERARAKAFVQKRFKLAEDPNARIFVFLGRWVKQKGVDYIADVAEWMLSKYPNAQLLMIGPVGDCFGSYARAKLETLMHSGLFEGNLFVHADFLIVPPELKLACDFCLMPSREEPFGYVDIEFAWFGASIVGSLKGGLGKLPGFYFQILNADSSSHMQEALRNAISEAMACPADVLMSMSARARASTFPVETWQNELLQAYEQVLLKFFSRTASEKLPPATPRGIAEADEAQDQDNDEFCCEEDLGKADSADLPPGVEFLRQEPSEKEMQERVEGKLASVAYSNAPALIEAAEWERELEQERSCLSRMLGKVVLGAPIVDWVICVCYVSGPLIPALTLAGVAKEDAECFAVLRPVVQAFMLVFWTFSALLVRPNTLMAVALMARAVPLVLPFVEHSASLAAITLGVVGSSDCLFLYYSFMGSSVGDVATLAMRTGLIMALRDQWEPLLMVLEDTPRRMQLWVTAVLGVWFVLLPALVLLNACSLYRVFSVPEISFKWVRKLRFLKLFAAATVFEAFSQNSQTALLKLREMEPFELPYARSYCFELAGAAAITMVLFSLVLRRFPSYAVVLVKAFACCTLPATVLQCWAEVEIDRAYRLSLGLDVLIFLSTMVGALSLYAGAVAVLATVGSRWRLVSYACAVGFCTSLSRAASYYVLAFVTQEPDLLHNPRGLPTHLARRLMYIVVTSSGSALLLRLAAFWFFENEATGILQTWGHKKLVRLAQRREQEGLEKTKRDKPKRSFAPRLFRACTSSSAATEDES